MDFLGGWGHCPAHHTRREVKNWSCVKSVSKVEMNGRGKMANLSHPDSAGVRDTSSCEQEPTAYALLGWAQRTHFGEK